MNLKQAVVFAILMQNRNGILEKAPHYVEEKYHQCQDYPDAEILLDSGNKAIFDEYFERWAAHIGEEDDQTR